MHWSSKTGFKMSFASTRMLRESDTQKHANKKIIIFIPRLKYFKKIIQRYYSNDLTINYHCCICPHSSVVLKSF